MMMDLPKHAFPVIIPAKPVIMALNAPIVMMQTIDLSHKLRVFVSVIPDTTMMVQISNVKTVIKRASPAQVPPQIIAQAVMPILSVFYLEPHVFLRPDITKLQLL